jgi:hypothetical protein
VESALILSFSPRGRQIYEIQSHTSICIRRRSGRYPLAMTPNNSKEGLQESLRFLFQRLNLPRPRFYIITSRQRRVKCKCNPLMLCCALPPSNYTISCISTSSLSSLSHSSSSPSSSTFSSLSATIPFSRICFIISSQLSFNFSSSHSRV